VEEPDYHLQPGSPAIDAGTSEGAPADDIEGNRRPRGGGFDIGMYEYNGFAGELLLDNGQPGTTGKGRWQAAADPDSYGADSLSAARRGKYSYAFRPTENRRYEVFLWWAEGSDRPRDARVRIRHAEGKSQTFVNQTVGSGKWNSLGSHLFAGEATITVQARGKGSTCADAVRLAPVAWETILDNGEEGTSSTGSWSRSKGRYRHGRDISRSSEAGSVYTYRVEVPRAGEYEVFLWWPAHKKNASSVRIEASPDDAAVHEFTVDQRNNGGRWNSLGIFEASGDLTVAVFSDGDGYACADAVRVAQRP
jgi:hypothetical protein